ncbi:unnamed protein product [Auanema sp. JU1783]|nr:unnamed protein product [Auanema sp. JU1783]
MQYYSNSSSYSSQSEDESHPEASPTQLLSIAIKKRRALFGRKDRNYHQELLQTGFIQSLCKHLGERRARRKKRGCSSSKLVFDNENSGCTESQKVPETLVEPVLQTPEPPIKRKLLSSDNDPFGLDRFFSDLLEKKPEQNERREVSMG